MNTSEVIEKIKKCFALAGSSNQHEAAAALRQANALMKKYEIDNADIAAHTISESSAKARVNRKPPHWEAALATTIGLAFQCETFFKIKRKTKGQWLFIGQTTSCQLAAYAFEVLLRQLTNSRRKFMATQPIFWHSSNKTRQADIFCHGWLSSIHEQVAHLVIDESTAEGIRSYIKKQYNGTGELDTAIRYDGHRLSREDEVAMRKGIAEGREAKLSRGVSEHDALQLGK